MSINKQKVLAIFLIGCILITILFATYNALTSNNKCKELGYKNVMLSKKEGLVCCNVAIVKDDFDKECEVFKEQKKP